MEQLKITVNLSHGFPFIDRQGEELYIAVDYFAEEFQYSTKLTFAESYQGHFKTLEEFAFGMLKEYNHPVLEWAHLLDNKAVVDWVMTDYDYLQDNNGYYYIFKI